MEYRKVPTASSGVAKAGMTTGIIGTALGVLNAGGGVLGGLAGPYRSPVTFGAAPAAVDCGFVSEKEMTLIRENSAQGSEIAQLKAEKYTDTVVAAAVVPLANRVCELEKQAAVNEARDRDFRRYVDAEFVHQPKACMHDSIVVTHGRDCGCHDHHHHC